MRRTKSDIFWMFATWAFIFGVLLNPFTKTFQQSLSGGLILASFFVMILLKGEKL